MRALRCIIVVALTLMAPWSAKAASTLYDCLFLEAVTQREKGNYDAAFDLLRYCLAINPEAAEAYFYIAPHYLMLRDKERALAAYEKAVELCPDNLTYLEVLARTYTASGRFDDAIRTLENFVEIDKSEESMLELLVTLYVQDAANYPKAIGILNRLEALEGKNESLSTTKSDIYSVMGDKEAAVKELKELADQYPHDLGYRCLYGDMLLKNGDDEEAYLTFQSVLAEEPDNSKAQMSLRTYYDKIGDKAAADSISLIVLSNKNTTDEERMYIIRQEIGEQTRGEADSTKVLSYFAVAIEAEQEPGGIGYACASYMDLIKMPQDTINEVLRRVLDKAPDYAPARLQLVAAAWEDDDMETAANLCGEARQYNPDDMVFYYYQGIALYRLNWDDEALEAFRNGLGVINSDSNPDIVSDVYAVMGDILYQQGSIQEAFDAYDSCLVWKKDNYACLNNYAYFLSERGERLDEAEAMSYRAIMAEPKNATYLDTYAWILFMQERYAEAQIYIDQAMQNDGDASAVIIEHAGDIAALNDNMPAALQLWETALEHDPTNAILRRKIEQKQYIQR